MIFGYLKGAERRGRTLSTSSLRLFQTCRGVEEKKENTEDEVVGREEGGRQEESLTLRWNFKRTKVELVLNESVII